MSLSPTIWPIAPTQLQTAASVLIRRVAIAIPLYFLEIVAGVNMGKLGVVPSVPVGKIKSFGAFGPKYEVREALRALDDGDWMVEVMLAETGEKAEYRLTHVNDDPEAR